MLPFFQLACEDEAFHLRDNLFVDRFVARVRDNNVQRAPFLGLVTSRAALALVEMFHVKHSLVLKLGAWMKPERPGVPVRPVARCGVPLRAVEAVGTFPTSPVSSTHVAYARCIYPICTL